MTLQIIKKIICRLLLLDNWPKKTKDDATLHHLILGIYTKMEEHIQENKEEGTMTVDYRYVAVKINGSRLEVTASYIYDNAIKLEFFSEVSPSMMEYLKKSGDDINNEESDEFINSLQFEEED